MSSGGGHNNLVVSRYLEEFHADRSDILCSIRFERITFHGHSQVLYAQFERRVMSLSEFRKVLCFVNMQAQVTSCKNKTSLTGKYDLDKYK